MFDGSVRRSVVLVAGNVQIIHSVCFGDRKDHSAGSGSIVMTAIRLVDFVTDIAVVVGMKVMTDSDADFSDRLTGIG